MCECVWAKTTPIRGKKANTPTVAEGAEFKHVAALTRRRGCWHRRCNGGYRCALSMARHRGSGMRRAQDGSVVSEHVGRFAPRWLTSGEPRGHCQSPRRLSRLRGGRVAFHAYRRAGGDAGGCARAARWTSAAWSVIALSRSRGPLTGAPQAHVASSTLRSERLSESAVRTAHLSYTFTPYGVLITGLDGRNPFILDLD